MLDDALEHVTLVPVLINYISGSSVTGQYLRLQNEVSTRAESLLYIKKDKTT